MLLENEMRQCLRGVINAGDVALSGFLKARVTICFHMFYYAFPTSRWYCLEMYIILNVARVL